MTQELEGGNLDRLPELHAIACCLKAVITSEAAKGVETCRLACGGHGYMSCSNFPGTYAMVTAACTYEGENTVMLLQTARFLVKSWGQALEGKKLVPMVTYLERAAKYDYKPTFQMSHTGFVEALQAVTAG